MARGNGTHETLRKPQILIGVGLGLWNTYLILAWLMSSYPWAAIYPGLFAGFFLWTAYSIWSSAPLHQGVRAIQLFGVIAAAGIAVMWTIAERTGNDVYLDQARGISVWGGLLVLGGLLTLMAQVHPTVREKIRASRRGQTR